MKTKLFIAALSTALFCGSASAALISHGTYTTDTSTSLDWLNVAATANMSVLQVLGDSTLSLAGWKYATVEQLTTFIKNNTGALPNSGPYSFDSRVINPTQADSLVSALGSTSDTYYSHTYGYETADDFMNNYNGYGWNPGMHLNFTQGYLADTFRGSVIVGWVYSWVTPDGINWSKASGYAEYAEYTQTRYDYGSFLVRDTALAVVPLPPSVFMFVAGLLGLGFARRKSNNQALTA